MYSFNDFQQKKEKIMHGRHKSNLASYGKNFVTAPIKSRDIESRYYYHVENLEIMIY